MTQITNIEEKQALADNIKRLVDELNAQIDLAKNLYINVNVDQDKDGGRRLTYLHLRVFISETVSY
jgi:hypothetical protein